MMIDLPENSIFPKKQNKTNSKEKDINNKVTNNRVSNNNNFYG